MSLLLFLLPVLCIGLCSLWPIRRQTATRVVSVLLPLTVVLAVLHHLGDTHVLTSPWLGSTFSNFGLIREGMFRSDREIPLLGRQALFFAVAICALASVESFLLYRRRFIAQSTAAQQPVPWRNISFLLLPLLVSYTLLLLPRATFRVTFDRYLLVIIAVLLVFLLVWHQRHVSDHIPVLSISMLAIITILTVADMHDLFAMSRAEVRVARELQNAGIPRTQIDGGFAFDFETQVRAGGYINDPHIVNPAGAYHPQPAVPEIKRGSFECNLFTLQSFLPAVHPRYVIVAFPTPCFVPASLPAQTYTTWLQPGKHQVSAGILLPPLQ